MSRYPPKRKICSSLAWLKPSNTHLVCEIPDIHHRYCQILDRDVYFRQDRQVEIDWVWPSPSWKINSVPLVHIVEACRSYTLYDRNDCVPAISNRASDNISIHLNKYPKEIHLGWASMWFGAELTCNQCQWLTLYRYSRWVYKKTFSLLARRAQSLQESGKRYRLHGQTVVPSAVIAPRNCCIVYTLIRVGDARSRSTCPAHSRRTTVCHVSQRSNWGMLSSNLCICAVVQSNR